jgi:uncharacterized SAM-binding protein YcdF (DUF218 family)
VKSLAALLILVMFWAVGLLAFTSRIEASTPAPAPPAADGIAVLTGGPARINAGLQLLEQEKGLRLLVTGVNPNVTRDELLAVTETSRGLYDCCVQLGFYAVDTRTNAAETRAWAENEGYRRLIVVTADYHMPRALLEMKGAMPNAEITAYPVATAEVDIDNWWKSSAQARLVIFEYCKYLAVLGREAFLSLGPDARQEDHPKAEEAGA